MMIDFRYKIQYFKTVQLIFVALIMLGGAPLDGWAQEKEYASSYYDEENVESPENAVDGDETTKATLESRELSLLPPLSKLNGRLGLRFATQVGVSQKAYVKVGVDDESVLQSLLGGSLGGALTDLLDNLVLGSHKYDFSLLDNGVLINEGKSSDGFAGGVFRVMQGGDGTFLFEINANDAFNEIRVDTRSDATLPLLGTGKRKFDIYDTYYFTSTGTTCGRPIGTSFDGSSGIDLSLLNLDNQHLNRAIDDDPDTYSELSNSSLLGLSVASTLSQYFYFPTESAETASVNVKLGMSSSGLLDLDLLGATEIVFYQGSDEVHKRSLKSSLLHNTNALNLLDAGDPVTLTFAPGRKFDRIEFRLNSPVGLNLLSAGFRIYDVERFDDAAGCPNPEIAAVPSATPDPFDEASCASGLIDFDNVDFAQRAVDGNNESYATIYADAGNLLVSGPTAGFIEMDLGETVPANKTTYVRINYDEDVLDRLVGGSLGKLVADLANNLLLGNQYFEVEAKNGNSSVLKEKSSDAFEGTADGTVTLVQDDIGRFYIAITPDSDYDRIRITNHVTAVLSTGKKASLDVYNACFEIGTDNCFPPNFTSYRGGGIGLNVGNISSVGVTNAYRAISENSSEYSEINLGVAGIAANVYQTIHFNKPSQPNDKVKIRLQVEPSSALSLDVLGAYKIKFYNGNDQVGSDYDLKNYALINNIDLLTLFSSGGTITLDFEPSATFDRVDIGAESIVELNVDAEPLRVYSVKRYGDTCPLLIGESPFESPTCAVELIASENADDVQNLFDGDFDSFATLNSGAGFLLGSNQHEGFVELGYDHDVPAGTTSYIRIDFEETILEKLVGGSLGNIVSGLLDGLVLGDHFFEVDIKHDGNSVAFASSGDASAGGNNAIRVVRDKQGRYYIAVTPDQDYNSVRISDKTQALLGALVPPNTMNVYGMCYENSTDKCLEAFATSYEYSGLSLSVNDLGGAGVANPQYAINDNSTQGSEIGLGTLSVTGGVKQWIFFNTVSAVDEVVNIRFKTGAGVADVALLGDLKIKAYLGNTEVAVLDWGTDGIISGVNVLDLINDGETVSLPFAPGVVFDRISVGIENLVNVSVFPPVELYSVTKRCKVGGLLITNPMIYQKTK